MKKRLLTYMRFIFTTLIIIALLQFSGLWLPVTTFAQSMILKSGILNADVVPDEHPEIFNYDFSIRNLKGEVVDFNSFKGKVIFLNIWATWCGPCRAEMPSIEQLYQKVNQTDIAFEMLSVDKEHQVNKVEPFVKNNQYTFPVYTLNGRLPEELQVPSIPTTFIIDKNGNIVMKEVGTRNYDTKKVVNFLNDLTSK